MNTESEEVINQEESKEIKKNLRGCGFGKSWLDNFFKWFFGHSSQLELTFKKPIKKIKGE